MSVVDGSLDHPLKMEEEAVIPLAGGIMQHGYQCGMIWGASLAAGAQAYRLFGPGPQAEARAIVAAQKVVESFQALTDNINCLEITDIDHSSSAMKTITYFFIKGGVIGCLRMAARYAPLASEAINTALAEPDLETPTPPVSCTAMVAQKMGTSDMHTVMAAGLAGGIGLCGGACGALGAAIWLMGINTLKAGGKVEFRSPQGMEAVERFIPTSGYEFECAEIVGRKFTDVGDHADYLHGGGCAEIIEGLAAG